MGASPKTVTDGWSSLEGGVDMGLPPSVIGRNQFAAAVDASMRGGFLRPRPSMRKVCTIAASGRWQGGTGYVGLDLRASVVVSVGGELFRVDVDKGQVAPLTALVNAPDIPRVWYAQAENYLVVQDGLSRSIIWDGANSRRAADDEVPIGTVTTYGLGRLWVATGRDYTGGDLVNSHPELGYASVLKFTENDFLNEGGAFSVPWAVGGITGMKFAAKPHTATGLAGLMVATNSGWFEFEAPVDRDVWKNLTQPLQRFALLGHGATSHESIVGVNGDLWFRSADGIRSFRYAERDFASWGNTPESGEMDGVVSTDDTGLLWAASSALWNNYLLTTVSPVARADGIEHRGVAVVDFSPISGMRRNTDPAWTGLWLVGYRVLQLIPVSVGARHRLFVAVRNAVDAIDLYEFTPEAAGHDWFGEDRVPFSWGGDSRSLTFQNEYQPKDLETAWVWADEKRGLVAMDVWFRPDGESCWWPWARWEHSSASCPEDAPDCNLPTMPRDEAWSRITLPVAPSSCAPWGPANHGYEFQLRIRITGKMRVKRVLVAAREVAAPMYPNLANGTVAALPCLTCST